MIHILETEPTHDLELRWRRLKWQWLGRYLKGFEEEIAYIYIYEKNFMGMNNIVYSILDLETNKRELLDIREGKWGIKSGVVWFDELYKNTIFFISMQTT